MQDEKWMELALLQARQAGLAGEVPVGAVLLHHGEVIASAHNRNRALHDPTAHAEILVLRAAAEQYKNFRLEDCELFVTLEPCAMCAGAIVHARLKRVVYGAADPKTGAAGSVLDIFAMQQLNHHTQVMGGIESHACAHLLQQFFQHRRSEQKKYKTPLREDALRTADHRFSDLPHFPWSAHYVTNVPALAGLRLHYVDTGCADGAEKVLLCLHGARTWSYVFHAHIANWVQQGFRVLAPDLIGFGKSDKPKKEAAHSLDFHVQYLLQWLEQLGVSQIALAVQGVGHTVAAQLQINAPDQFTNAPVQVVSHSGDDAMAYQAPFPDRGYQAGMRALIQFEPKDGADTSL
jgi:tRNA(adenine34) deaminase